MSLCALGEAHRVLDCVCVPWKHLFKTINTTRIWPEGNVTHTTVSHLTRLSSQDLFTLLSPSISRWVLSHTYKHKHMHRYQQELVKGNLTVIIEWWEKDKIDQSNSKLWMCLCVWEVEEEEVCVGGGEHSTNENLDGNTIICVWRGRKMWPESCWWHLRSWTLYETVVLGNNKS